MQYAKQARKNPEPRTENRALARSADGRGTEGYSYRNLIVWQKAQEVTLEIIRLVAGFPRNRVADIITDQIVRCSSSVGANIAEGHGRFSLGAHANYLSIAKASACETDNFLDLARRAGLISDAIEAELHSNCQEVIRMLTAKILDLGRLQKSKVPGNRLGEEAAIYQADDYSSEDPVLGSGFSVLGGRA